MQESHHIFIQGKWRKGEGGIRKIMNPSSGEVLTEVKEATEEQVDEAVLAARRAFETTNWAENIELRVQMLRELSDKLEESAEEFALLETRNTGKPIRESRLDVSDSITCLRYYADLVANRICWEKEMYDGTISKVVEEPIGVCGLIVPWNFPLLLGIWKLAPALAAGNTVIFKPSEVTPLSFLKLTELIEKSEMPPGVFNLVLGEGRSVGHSLVAHPEVDKISFTGGSATGRRIYQECAKNLKRVSLELGGKSPLLVFDDVDLATAVDWAMFGSFFNQGQVCVASSRILVHQSLYDDFLTHLSARAAQIVIGDPVDETTEMGPLVSEAHRKKVEEYIQIGLTDGARLLSGGQRIPDRSGYYLSPAIFTDVKQDMRIVQEEIFGPVITVQPFKEEIEAIQLANDTPFGLAAGVLSRDLERAERVAGRLRAGTVWINGYHTPHVETPWGGFKQSGIGRELGPQGLAAFTEAKHINRNLQLQPIGWYSNKGVSS
ncbi:betaine-aldehyde dehydrogenase [Collibacillus ludicampi]|uniref:aldehyde dehydrogenase (NAD(+)) n=1 Tax=Collibacillus ludicampi TaxID=2771369 RepID=A0AAV4LFP3_9BACL|nr:aldehyde dehydrogenase family protein [Collibacillus ludicampi]GIM46541.1 betaine-aldehyde dehydrogenase [Collibacillus ludicampi]